MLTLRAADPVAAALFTARADLDGRDGTSLNADIVSVDTYLQGTTVPVDCQAKGDAAYGSKSGTGPTTVSQLLLGCRPCGIASLSPGGYSDYNSLGARHQRVRKPQLRHPRPRLSTRQLVTAAGPETLPGPAAVDGSPTRRTSATVEIELLYVRIAVPPASDIESTTG
ncbi:hypothetical protein ASC99_13405 [Kitasatospora sp. Root107]|nr:hypothetical protein ASC99_13405 [Kitasatospora sp. Root107]